MSPSFSHRSLHLHRLRTSAIAALALAGVFLLAIDQVPGRSNVEIFGKVLRKNSNVLRGRSLPGLSFNDYEYALHRALTSSATDDDGMSVGGHGRGHAPAREVDSEEIARRVLKEEPRNIRHLSSDNPNYEIIRAAQNVHKRNSEKQPFLFVLEASVGMIPMVKSWICNTATMEGVHENTLLILDEPGKKLLDAFDPAKGMHVVQDSIPKSLEGSWAFGELGYWLATQHRFHTILDIIELGNVPAMIIEPDAVWLENPLDDPDIVDSDEDIVAFVNMVRPDGTNGPIGFGFLRLNPTDTVIKMLTVAGRAVDSILKEASKGTEDDPSYQVGSIKGEQNVFSELIQALADRYPERKLAHYLPDCRYPSGKWYMAGAKCQRGGARSTMVIQNNWICGNDKKIERAKEWGHWFLSDDENRCIRTDLKIARQSVETGVKPKPEELVEDAKVADLSEE